MEEKKEESEHSEEIQKHNNFNAGARHHLAPDHALLTQITENVFDPDTLLNIDKQELLRAFKNPYQSRFTKPLKPQQIVDKAKFAEENPKSIKKEFKALAEVESIFENTAFDDSLFEEKEGNNIIRNFRGIESVQKRNYVNTGNYRIESNKEQDIINHFVHAHYITDPVTRIPEKFISSQSPKERVIGNFLRMILFKKIALVVMLCQYSEFEVIGGKSKCSMYLPDSGKQLQFGGYIIRNIGESEHNGLGSYISHYEIKLSEAFSIGGKSQLDLRGTTHRFTHLHYYLWPDMGVPELDQIEPIFVKFDETMAAFPNRPVLVHCSQGVGRTGTLEALFFLRELMNEYKQKIRKRKISILRSKPTFSIFNLVLSLRQMRQSSVYTVAQYTALYQYLETLFNKAAEEGFSDFKTI